MDKGREIVLDRELPKAAVVRIYGNWIKNLGYKAKEVDFERPWGGFWKLDQAGLEKFLDQFFPELKEELTASGADLSPKFLLVAPGQRLSWQYHFRRAECWRAVAGPVGVFSSNDDQQPEKMRILNEGELVRLNQGERHRLVGLPGGNWGLVAEVWVHTDRDNPSDEADIVRLQDDTGRK